MKHAHHPNVVGGASFQCSQDGGCTVDPLRLQGSFWWGVHLPWLSGVLDSVVHSSPSNSLPSYCQSWRSVLHTLSDTDTHHTATPTTVSGTCTWKNTKGKVQLLVTTTYTTCTDWDISTSMHINITCYAYCTWWRMQQPLTYVARYVL